MKLTALTEAMEQGKLTIEQLETLRWLKSPEGEAVRASMPQAFEGVDEEILGFDYLSQDDALLQRQLKGFSGNADDRVVWSNRFGDWTRSVCYGALTNLKPVPE